MKINQIITETAVVQDKVAKVIRHLVTHGPRLPDDVLLSDVQEVVTDIVSQNPSTDLNQLLTMVKDKLGAEVDEASNKKFTLGGESGKKLGRIAKNKTRSFKKSFNKLQDLYSTKSGRFNKARLDKLTNPLSEDDITE